MVGLIETPATQDINNVASEMKSQQVQAETPRKASTLVKEEEKALTEPETKPQPENVVATTQPVKVESPAPQTQGCERYRSLISQYDWDIPTAMAVMQAESGCNPTAYSATRDRGLMQINAVHAAKVDGQLERLFDPATNIRVAYSVYQSQGWNGWMAYVNGKHLKFL